MAASIEKWVKLGPEHDPEEWEPVFHATNAKRLRAARRRFFLTRD
jgi:hypothetical protein